MQNHFPNVVILLNLQEIFTLSRASRLGKNEIICFQLWPFPDFYYIIYNTMCLLSLPYVINKRITFKDLTAQLGKHSLQTHRYQCSHQYGFLVLYAVIKKLMCQVDLLECNHSLRTYKCVLFACIPRRRSANSVRSIRRFCCCYSVSSISIDYELHSGSSGLRT